MQIKTHQLKFWLRISSVMVAVFGDVSCYLKRDPS